MLFSFAEIARCTRALAVTLGKSSKLVVCVGLLVMLCCWSRPVAGAVVWDGGDNTNWWYDPVNWNANGNDNVTLPNMGTQVNNATELDGTTAGPINVVFDPDNDPNEPAHPFNPYATYDLYLGNSGTNSSTLTIKSGTLQVSNPSAISGHGNMIVARSVVNQTDTVVQLGGTVQITDTVNGRLSLGSTTGATGIYEYHGGNLEVDVGAAAGSLGIRIGGDSTGSSGLGNGIFKDYNDGPAGHIHAANVLVSSGGGNSTGTVEFHLDNGGVRPIQVDGDLSLRNIGTTQHSYLNLVLDSAPTVSGGVPENLGLFSLGTTGVYTSAGSQTLPKAFQVAPGGSLSLTDDVNGDGFISTGDEVSASFGGTTYNWIASYAGKIMMDPTTSAISSITQTGGSDMVLIGLSSASSILLGDMNFDGVVDAKDIGALESALANPDQFVLDHPGHGLTASNLGQYADVSGNGQFNNADIQSLINKLLTGAPSLSTVPEPSTLALAGLGFAALGLWSKRRKAA